MLFIRGMVDIIFFSKLRYKNLDWCYIKQIMNAFHSCNGTAIFIRWKTECSIQLGFASLNRTFHLSSHENICTIALITIHYLYTTDTFDNTKRVGTNFSQIKHAMENLLLSVLMGNINNTDKRKIFELKFINRYNAINNGLNKNSSYLNLYNIYKLLISAIYLYFICIYIL